MPTIRVAIALPYFLALPAGPYFAPGLGGELHLAEIAAGSSHHIKEPQTQASMTFEVSDVENAESQERRREIEADHLLLRINRLLRWYRVATGQAPVIELTRAQASPFHFSTEGTGVSWGGDSPLEYKATFLPAPAGGNRANLGQVVRQGLAAGTDPDVATLNLLDAEYALSIGRFREAVLLCWGAIDSTFVRSFKRLVDERLGQEWPEARDFLKGIDFGLRHKMTTGLRLLTGHSLYAEPDHFWQELSASYNLRNRIIHEGHVAHEDDAKRSIHVARRVVQIVRSQSPQ